MYSPRRGSSKYRSRQYYKKKRINNKFSPALYKSPIPTYFQQRGRIIQTSPARIPIVPRFLPNRETLDDMYNALIQANYPGVGPSPSFQYNGYYFTFYSTAISDIFKFNPATAVTSDVIDSTWLNDYVTNYVQRPPLPEGYEIQAHIFALNFDFPPGDDGNTFLLKWHSTIISNDTDIVDHNVAASNLPNYNNLFVLLSPRSTQSLCYNQIIFMGSSIETELTTISTNQNISTENQFYPFVSSDDPRLASYLRVIRSDNSYQPQGNICFFIIYRYIESL